MSENLGTAADPKGNRIRTVRPCNVAGCVDGAHDYLGEEKDGMCFAMGIGEDKKDEAWYVTGYRDESTGLWSAFSEDPDLVNLAGAAGLVTLERYALAFRIVQQHCEVLNEIARSSHDVE